MKKYIVSACLIGKNCVYDGSSNHNPTIKELVDCGDAVAVCPEELGGLKTPRSPAEIFAGSAQDVLRGKAFVFNKEGKDITINIVKGSREFLKIAEECGVKKAILKTNSPCCGKGKIYDGSFTNRLIKGNGVTVELLLKNGIDVISDEEFSRNNGFLSNKHKSVQGINKNNAKRKKAKRR